MIRKPIVAGQFYESDEKKLIQQIEESFSHQKGPGSIPSGQREGSIKGVISPHAGYPFSGPCAAHGFKAIAESEMADLYIILGPSHIGFHKSCFSEDDWETPLGLARTDSDFGLILEENHINLIPMPHKEEHSIEVQVPMLQYACRDKEDKMMFVPVMVAETDYKETAERLQKAISEYVEKGKSIVLIASSDFTHLGANYGFMPFSENVKDNMYKLDKGAIDKILKLNPEGFMEYCEETGATICGKYAIYVMIEVMRSLKASPKLLQYYTSADILGDYSNAVGYASILFS
ncbi:AmmeMemoRadiSam system protein B [Candidatus Woesearchaeota archaeon]|nr:AmmeMemoRadiSam system protein B [Candidatus Woesearchaeota archaeon]